MPPFVNGGALVKIVVVAQPIAASGAEKGAP